MTSGEPPPPPSIPPPPPLPPPSGAHLDASTPAQRGRATAALVASATGLMIPLAGPVLGIALAYSVLWPLRGRTPNQASRTAMIAVVLGGFALGVPGAVLTVVKADDWGHWPLATLVVVIGLVLGVALQLAGVSRRASAATVVGTIGGTAVAAGAAVLAMLAVVWVLVFMVGEILDAIFS